MSSNYPPGVTGNEAYFNPPDDPDDDWVESKAKQLALNDAQLWDNLPSAAKNSYREQAKDEWYD
jgi:hypothetical protein